ncbi:MAG: hypothetical protein LC733_04605 [Actinobacteria bacterium]|nr:hypothetical protein [Actinomycetota bacterium]
MSDFPVRRLVTLGPEDIDQVMDLEVRAFDPAMQASRAKILHRFSLGHQMLGTTEDGRLMGTIGFSAVRFDPDDMSGFPKNFDSYSTQPVPADADTLCLYSIGIDPAARGMPNSRLLIHSAFDRGREQGLTRAVADGPLPSYNGNEQVRARPAVKQMVARYLQTGEFPPPEDFLHDPVLALYTRLTGCRCLRFLPDFMPEDESSGGWRVLLYQDL